MERLQHRIHAWRIVKLVMPELIGGAAQRQQAWRVLTDAALAVYTNLAVQSETGR